jgi:pimeloyl-ACP methyl ester carboxylesterase
MKLATRILVIGTLAVFLCAVALAVIVRDRPARPPEGERVVIHGAAGELVYYRQGTGPTVVLLPSFARSASDFDALAAGLAAAGFRTLALQPRGVDGSAFGSWAPSLKDFATDVVAVLDAEGGVRAHAVLGHAFGNRVARALATYYPKRIDTLILFSAGGETPPPDDVTAAIRKAIFGFDGPLRDEAIHFAFFADGNTVPPEWRSGWYPAAGILQTRATTAQSPASWRGGGRAQMLVLQPQEDKPAPAEQSSRLAADFPGRITLRVIAGAGHALLPERPHEVLDNVVGFLRAVRESDR